MSDSPLMTQIDTDLKTALRNRDEVAKLALRAVKTAVTELLKSENGPRTLTDDLLQEILQQEAKRRRDAMLQYEKAGRQDLWAQEQAELSVLERYLPQQLTEQEIEALARAVIAETGAGSMREMGQVMGRLMPQVSGRADGRLVNSVVRRLLG